MVKILKDFLLEVVFVREKYIQNSDYLGFENPVKNHCIYNELRLMVLFRFFNPV